MDGFRVTLLPLSLHLSSGTNPELDLLVSWLLLSPITFWCVLSPTFWLSRDLFYALFTLLVTLFSILKVSEKI